MSKIVFTLWFLLLGGHWILFIPGCGALPEEPGPPYNPFDPANPDYQKPVAIISYGPDSGATITSDEITFSWTGNVDNMLFRTRLDSQNWTVFNQALSVRYTDLDEFDHLFRIQARYPSGDSGEEISIPFTVNAISGPALLLQPKKMQIAAGEQFTLELWVDETEPIAGISTVLNFEASQIRAVSIDFAEGNDESFLLKNGGRLISFSETDNINGEVSLDCAVTEGSQRNVAGSGIIARITFEHISGTDVSISISGQSIFRNNVNNPVNILSFAGAQIIVE